MLSEIVSEIDAWRSAGERIALATVVRTSGSTPRPVGAAMAMTESGLIAGSVSGGCVEGAVYEEGMEALRSSRGRLVHYGISDEMAWDVGLSCGGQLDVFVEPLSW